MSTSVRSSVASRWPAARRRRCRCRTFGGQQQLQRLADLAAVAFAHRGCTSAFLRSLSGYPWCKAPSWKERHPSGMSTTTGLGRPERAMWKAFLIVSARSRGSLTRKLCLTMGRVMPTVSHSWKASRPMDAVGTWTGDDHHRDAVHVGRGDAGDGIGHAGPDVTSATPTSPVARAYPSAACTAACSWRTSTC